MDQQPNSDAVVDANVALAQAGAQEYMDSRFRGNDTVISN